MRRHGDAHGGMSTNVMAVGTAGVVLGALALLAPSPAAAAGQLQSCVGDLSAGTVECFDSQAAAEAAVTGGAEQTAAYGGAVTLAAEASEVVIGRIYENSGYGGAVFIFVAESGCDSQSDIDRRRNVMPAGWNDEVSSFTGHSRCQLKLWQHDYLAGNSFGQVGSAWSVGSMNDETSSISFH